MQGNVCGNCGRPVYFAERKTSLGRDWHPNCLRCKECGKILNPGQHAEHKGLPYCHTPCYKALFGPSILGYGSNVHTPANYRNGKPFDGITHTSNMDGISTKIFSFAKSVQNNVRSAMSFDTKEKPAAMGGETTTKYTPEEQEMLKKVESYNAYYEGKVRHQMTTEKTESEFVIEGPLRIYWGVTRPIQLEQCDNIKPPPVSSWRHSLYPTRTPKQRPVTVIEGRDPVTRAHANGVRFAEDIAELTPPASPKKSYGFDDSIIASQTDGVVRRKNLRKFNTVAYRGDAPNKWKRASINGHIYNYDTSVFTPVLGSCTSVSVDSNMNTSQVIKTLMEKFKVVNRPDEYQLCLVTEKEERLLTDRDYPLALRIEMGPDETKTRLFIKEKQQEAPKTPTISSMPIQEEPPEILPEEVETLLVLPDAVLTGVLKKYEEDEKKDIKVIKMRFEQIKRRIINRMEELRKTQSA